MFLIGVNLIGNTPYATYIYSSDFGYVIRGLPDGKVVQGIATDDMLPLTTAPAQTPHGSCEKVANDFGSAGGFSQVLFPH